MALREGMAERQGFTGVPGAKSLLLLPVALPLGLEQMKGVLSASGRHKRGNIAERAEADK